MMLPMTDKWQRLADQVVRRRGVLGLTQAQVAQRGLLSLDRVQAIEGVRGTRYRAGTVAALERALRWEHGSVDEILAGGEPTPIVDRHVALDDSATATDDMAVEEVDPLEARIRALEARVAEGEEEVRRLRAEISAYEDRGSASA